MKLVKAIGEDVCLLQVITEHSLLSKKNKNKVVGPDVSPEDQNSPAHASTSRNLIKSKKKSTSNDDAPNDATNKKKTMF